MTQYNYFVDEDIRSAYTLPSDLYTSEEWYLFFKNHLFRNSWQWTGGIEIWKNEVCVYPFYFCEGSLDEPLILTRSNDEIKCLSNVCTHRANIIVAEPTTRARFSCHYHGRCFDLQGKMCGMPEFDDVVGFPSQSDHLTLYQVQKAFGFYFTAIKPSYDFNIVFAPLWQYCRNYPFDELEFQPEYSRDYHVKANWMTYCDNYSEGFHIPFVHPALNKTISYDDYTVRTFEHCTLQVGYCKPGEKSLPLMEDDPDYGQEVYAYYWFVYPNLMINFYHWGISVNIVEPVGPESTRIKFRTYLRKGFSTDALEDTALHITEFEDEQIVENVQCGLRSSSYTRGRFSPSREQGVHAFHLYISRLLYQMELPDNQR